MAAPLRRYGVPEGISCTYADNMPIHAAAIHVRRLDRTILVSHSRYTIRLTPQVDPVSGRVQVQPQHPGGARTTSGRTASGRTVSGRPSSAGQAHGHKGSLLFRPLAPLPNDVTSN